MNATKFFTDNLNRLGSPPAPEDAAAWNLNWGLLLMARQLTDIQSAQTALRQQQGNLEQLVRRIPAQ